MNNLSVFPTPSSTQLSMGAVVYICKLYSFVELGSGVASGIFSRVHKSGARICDRHLFLSGARYGSNLHLYTTLRMTLRKASVLGATSTDFGGKLH